MDIYSALLLGVITRLRDPAGPFAQADQVRPWVDLAIDELMPSEELIGELSREVPIALVTSGGGSAGDGSADGGDGRETVRVWFAAPAPSMEAAVLGDGATYWGQGALRQWIEDRLTDRAFTVAGWEPLEWERTEPKAVPGFSALMVAVFSCVRLMPN